MRRTQSSSAACARVITLWLVHFNIDLSYHLQSNDEREENGRSSAKRVVNRDSFLDHEESLDLEENNSHSSDIEEQESY
jgi:hypothetical protein